MDDNHLDALRRLGGPSVPSGSENRRHSLREEYGDDIYPVETLMMFRRSGRETRAAVKVADGMWRLTGAVWLRRWDGLLRKVGHGYDPSAVD